MVSAALRVLLWNVAWRRPGTDGGRAIRGILAREDPDIMCLTETQLDLPTNGYVIASDPRRDGLAAGY